MIDLTCRLVIDSRSDHLITSLMVLLLLLLSQIDDIIVREAGCVHFLNTLSLEVLMTMAYT